MNRIRIVTLLTFIIIASLVVKSQNLPLGYIEQFNNKCNSENIFKWLVPEFDNNWKLNNTKNGKQLVIQSSDTTINKTLPPVKGILNYLVYGDYILEFEFFIPASSVNPQGFYFLGPIRSRGTYYAFGFSTDSVSFYFVDRGISNLIDKKPKQIAPLKWNKVRVERDILTRATTIVINGESKNSITFSDKNLVMGFLGFGSNLANSRLRNITVWAPTSITDSTFSWHPVSDSK